MGKSSYCGGGGGVCGIGAARAAAASSLPDSDSDVVMNGSGAERSSAEPTETRKSPRKCKSLEKSNPADTQ